LLNKDIWTSSEKNLIIQNSKLIGLKVVNNQLINIGLRGGMESLINQNVVRPGLNYVNEINQNAKDESNIMVPQKIDNPTSQQLIHYMWKETQTREQKAWLTSVADKFHLKRSELELINVTQDNIEPANRITMCYKQKQNFYSLIRT